MVLGGTGRAPCTLLLVRLLIALHLTDLCLYHQSWIMAALSLVLYRLQISLPPLLVRLRVATPRRFVLSEE